VTPQHGGAWQRARDAVHLPVFAGASLIALTFVAFGACFPDVAERAFTALQDSIVVQLGWLYVVTTTFVVGLALWLLLGPAAHIRLGPDDARPEFSRLSWFAMLFSAGMGTGLVFWSVAEPLHHYLEPAQVAPGTWEAAGEAVRWTFFHWGLHPWALYIVVGATLAHQHFRHGMPLAPRSLLRPLLGQRVRGPIGHAVDILATVGTLFGVATSLGLGAMQINAGASAAWDIERGVGPQLLIIAGITAVATVSVALGIDRGIRRLSHLNMIIAAGLLVFVLTMGPTLLQIDLFVTTLGVYVQRLVETSLWVDPWSDGRWQKDWTLFYWGWWLSWAPFVGMFIARISKGRTIRDFVLSVMLVPTGVAFVWLGAMGGTALSFEISQPGLLSEQAIDEPPTALHALLAQLPAAELTSLLATALVAVFFVTSSDSGSLVTTLMTSSGRSSGWIITAQRIFWALSKGAIAATLLVAGGLAALRAGALATGLPMALLILATAAGLIKALRRERA
jgi:choline/glycine/proline betaine transport protein